MPIATRLPISKYILFQSTSVELSEIPGTDDMVDYRRKADIDQILILSK